MRLLVVGAAALLALRQPIGMLRRGGWEKETVGASWAEPSLGGLRPGPGERIALLVPPLASSMDDAGMWYAAQYALVPGLVEPVMLRDCFGPDRPRCRLGGSGRVVAPSSHPEWVARAARELGLETVGTSGAVLLMRARDGGAR